mgnify:CR=1 FL=1
MDELGDSECQVDALPSVEAWVADGLVAAVQVGVNQFVAAAEAFGDVFAGQFDVDAAGPGALGAVGTPTTSHGSVTAPTDIPLSLIHISEPTRPY